MSQPTEPLSDAAHRSRLRWRCRRGMRELDVLMLRYLEHRYDVAPAAERAAFEALVELQDPQLYAFVTGREAPEDPEIAHVVARLTLAGS